jgi:beta-N-acetylhexosaminidase
VLLLAACATQPEPQRYEDPADPIRQAAADEQDDSPEAQPPDPVIEGLPDPTGEAVPAPDRDRVSDRTVTAIMERMTLRQRIGQRFITFVPGTRLRDGADQIIRAVNPAGFIVYPWNFESASEARVLINTLQFYASAYQPGVSLLVAADQEGGRVRALRFPELVTLPSAAVLGSLRDPQAIAAAAYLNSRQIRELGVNMNLAPVLDLYRRADESIIGDRSFGADPLTVADYVAPYLEASRQAGVIATAKHFPGHGVTTVDSHIELPVVRMEDSELSVGPLVPFVRAIEHGVPAIMTAHLVFSDIDPDYPVTISEVFMHDILRGELGYEGVVITDGLEMGAMSENFDLETTLIRLFRYDVDLILLYTRYDVVEVVKTVERLVVEGKISREEVDRGVRRVLQLKQAYGLLSEAVQ